jgi:hypothetical protein
MPAPHVPAKKTVYVIMSELKEEEEEEEEGKREKRERGRRERPCGVPAQQEKKLYVERLNIKTYVIDG